MTKQEEIREGIAKVCYCYYPWAELIPWDETDIEDRAECYLQAESLLSYLHSKGVVVRTPTNLLTNEYYANNVGEYVEPLIEEER